MSLRTYTTLLKTRLPFVYSLYTAVSDRRRFEVFSKIYRDNVWQFVSGAGSTLAATEKLRQGLADLLSDWEVRTILDLPCGNYAWMSKVDIGDCKYIGGDIVEELVIQNRRQYGDIKRQFVVLDITSSSLPIVDLILCRDCLVHLSTKLVLKALRNIKSGGSRYLVTTTFPDHDRNNDIKTGDWRPLNLCLPPFNLPQPITLIRECCTEAGGIYQDKSLGLWRIADIPTTIS
jgi:SAM-dependent methyltransferase